MGRPPLGSAKLSRTIGVHVTQDQYELIAQQGIPGVWARRVVLAALEQATAPRRKPPTPTQPPQPPPEPKKARHTLAGALAKGLTTDDPPDHRHKRERTGDHWVGGQNVGAWRCSICLNPLSWS